MTTTTTDTTNTGEPVLMNGPAGVIDGGAAARDAGGADGAHAPGDGAAHELAAREGKTGREDRRSTVELREDGDGRATVFGYASMFDEPYTVTDMFGEYEEVVRHGAFERTIREQDVRLYVNHEGLAIARSSAPGEVGRLKLAEDSVGLAYEAQVDTGVRAVDDLVRLMRAGVMRESSFAFQPIRQRWSKDYTERELIELKLYDVSVVSLPASPTTVAGVRHAEAIRWLTEVDPAEIMNELRHAGVGAGAVLEAITRLSGVAVEGREGHVDADSEPAVRAAIAALEQLLAPPAPPARDADTMMSEQAIVEIARRRR